MDWFDWDDFTLKVGFTGVGARKGDGPEGHIGYTGAWFDWLDCRTGREGRTGYTGSERAGGGFTGSWMRKGGGVVSLGRVKDGLVAQVGFTRTGEKDELVGLGRFHTDSRFHRAVSLGQGRDSRLVTLGWMRKGGAVALERARRHG